MSTLADERRRLVAQYAAKAEQVRAECWGRGERKGSESLLMILANDLLTACSFFTDADVQAAELVAALDKVGGGPFAREVLAKVARGRHNLACGQTHRFETCPTPLCVEARTAARAAPTTLASTPMPPPPHKEKGSSA